jgi:hypothetical protein
MRHPPIAAWPLKQVEFPCYLLSQYTLSAMNRTISQLERRIAAIKKRLMALGDLRPGSLSLQYHVCGSPGCRCKASPPEKHGPYGQLSFTRKGRGTSRFVRKADLSQVKRQLKNYASLKTLVDEWIELSAELCSLRIQEARKPPSGS